MYYFAYVKQKCLKKSRHPKSVIITLTKIFACAYFWEITALAVYIINSGGIAYHQHKVLYIIKPQGLYAR